MKTTRIVLKVPFYKHPAGTVFDLADNAEPADWPEDERLREKLSFSNKMVYFLPDGGRGFGVSLPVSDTAPCPDHVFDGHDTREGEARVTMVETRHTDENKADETPPCGRLPEQNVSVRINEALSSRGFLIDLPPFQDIAEKMVLLDVLQNVQVMDYPLRNYKHADTQLKWDVSDLNPGFYELRVCFPGDWFHSIRFIKFYPFYVDAANIPAAPPKEWQPIMDQVLEKFTTSNLVHPPGPDLQNEALDLCLEWGEMFNKPTQERMMRRHSDLTQAEADQLDKLAREVRDFVYDLCQQESEGKLAKSDFRFQTIRTYPWVNTDNFNRMVSVGMYYARR